MPTSGRNFGEWITRMEISLAGFAESFEDRYGYAAGDNVVVRAMSDQARDRRAALSRIGAPGDLLDLYAVVDSVSMPDVDVGYFIACPEDVIEGHGNWHPTTISGDVSDEVVVFGSNGGVALFAISKSRSSIYRLEGGALIGPDYQVSAPGPAVAFDDVRQFIDELERMVRR